MSCGISPNFSYIFRAASARALFAAKSSRVAPVHVEGDALQLHLVEVLQQVFRGLVLAQHFRPHPDAHPPGCNVLPAKKGGAGGCALLDESGGQKSEGRATNLGQAFDVARSCYYVHRLRRRRVDARRVALRSQVNQLFSQSRGSAGSRSILGMLREEGVTIGRFRVRRLMRELGLVRHSRQPRGSGCHR